VDLRWALFCILTKSECLGNMSVAVVPNFVQFERSFASNEHVHVTYGLCGFVYFYYGQTLCKIHDDTQLFSTAIVAINALTLLNG